jgi:tetratricopeptide (TPR) repeat protein
MVLLKLGKLDEALDAYNQAIAKNEGASSLMGRAFVYLQKGDRARAEGDAAAARKLTPKIDETFAQYGLRLDQSLSQSGTVAQSTSSKP